MAGVTGLVDFRKEVQGRLQFWIMRRRDIVYIVKPWEKPVALMRLLIIQPESL